MSFGTETLCEEVLQKLPAPVRSAYDCLREQGWTFSWEGKTLGCYGSSEKAEAICRFVIGSCEEGKSHRQVLVCWYGTGDRWYNDKIKRAFCIETAKVHDFASKGVLENNLSAMEAIEEHWKIAYIESFPEGLKRLYKNIAQFDRGYSAGFTRIGVCFTFRGVHPTLVRQMSVDLPATEVDGVLWYNVYCNRGIFEPPQTLRVADACLGKVFADM